MIQKILFCIFIGSSVTMAQCPESGTFSVHRTMSSTNQRMINIYKCHDSIPITTNQKIEENYSCLPPSLLRSYLKQTIQFQGVIAPGKYKSIYGALKTLGFENGEEDFDETNPQSKISQFIKENPHSSLCLSGLIDTSNLDQTRAVEDAAQYLADDMNRYFKLGNEEFTGFKNATMKKSSEQK